MTAGTPHPFFASPVPRVLAHRGLVTADAAAGGVVENSFAAIAAAHAAGVEIVESDCHLTRDGVVVLFHDDDLSRVTGDPRAVSEVSERELSALMADRGGLVTLEQALDAFPGLRFNLDAKAPGVEQPLGRAIAEDAHRVLVASFSDERRLATLAAVEAAGAGIRPATSAGTRTVAWLLVALALRSQRLAARALAGIDALQLPERRGRLRIVTPRLINTAHRQGVEVHVWTVDDPDDMRRLIGMGVDAIVTDRADLALQTIR